MRFVRFNGVGIVGFAVQIGALVTLMRMGMPYLPATAIAVELSILNNFLWHERWTWQDRPASGRARLLRLVRFHALNGVVSLGGNLLIVSTLVDESGTSPVVANVVAVLACGILNFFGADQVVFVSRGSSNLTATGDRGSASRGLQRAARRESRRITLPASTGPLQASQRLTRR